MQSARENYPFYKKVKKSTVKCTTRKIVTFFFDGLQNAACSPSD